MWNFPSFNKLFFFKLQKLKLSILYIYYLSQYQILSKHHSSCVFFANRLFRQSDISTWYLRYQNTLKAESAWIKSCVLSTVSGFVTFWMTVPLVTPVYVTTVASLSFFTSHSAKSGRRLFDKTVTWSHWCCTPVSTETSECHMHTASCAPLMSERFWKRLRFGDVSEYNQIVNEIRLIHQNLPQHELNECLTFIQTQWHRARLPSLLALI